MAQIIKRGEKLYYIRVFLGRDTDGHKRFHNETFHGGFKLATDKARSLETQRDLGTLLGEGTLSLAAYLERWLSDAVRGKVSNSTHTQYKWQMKRYVEEPLGMVPLRNLTPLHIQGVYTNMQKAGLSSRTIRYTHAVLSAALNQAFNWGYLPRNPAKLVKIPKLERTVHIRPLDSVEVGLFLRAATGHHLEALFRLALDSGMRPEEYLGLTWPSLDLTARIARVEKVLVWSKGGGWELRSPKTEGSRRQIPLSADTVKILTEHRRKQNALKMKRGAKYKQKGFVFASPNGSPLNLPNLRNREFKPLLKAAKLDEKKFRLYDLRHTMATLLLKDNVHPKIVSERLGHASVSMTLDTYSHILPTMQETATASLTKFLQPAALKIVPQ